MYFDSHTHLNNKQLYPQRQQHLQDFIQKDGIGLINIGVNHEYNTRGIEIARSFHGVTATIEPVRSLRGKYNSFKSEHSKQESDADGIGVWCTIGLHPYEVVSGDITDSNLHHKLKEMSLLYAPYKECIVAIGECGIDTHYPDSHTTLALQKDLFRQQCDLARQWDLPIVIHSRANRQATHEILQNFKDLTIYFHCRSYTPDEIKIIKSTYPNFYIGFCGNISYPKASEIRKSLRFLVHENENYPDHIMSGKVEEMRHPAFYSRLREEGSGAESKDLMKLSNILIETDAPYLAPQSHRGETNTPALIVETYSYISSLLGMDITSQVGENAKRCYRL